MIYESVNGCIGRTPLVALNRLFPADSLNVIAKLEFLNPGGSIKDRVAQFIVEQGLRDGIIHSKTHLIESSSGNLGIALAMIARVYGLAFTCVVDPMISPANLRILQKLGVHIEMVNTPDDQGGYLNTRIERVKTLLQVIPGSYWINQYANQSNWKAHYYGTGGEILEDLDEPIDCFIAAVSTTGTIMGVSRRLREVFPHLRVIAVDAIGSVIFGTQPGLRQIQGIGASRVPEIFCSDEISEAIHITETEAVQGCYDLLTHEGIFAGGSSGFVIAAIQKLLSTFPSSYRVLTILPDRGERYFDIIYLEE